MQIEEEEYDEALDTFQSLQRRFPKHPCAKDSYVLVSKVYLTKALKEFPDSNLIDMAKINLRNFQREFPGSDLDFKIQENLVALQEVFAKELVEIMDFYLRTNKAGAARLYAERIVRTYPDTKSAQKAIDMLAKIAKIEAKREKKKK
jgi:outer membrane protein assembly factor BamD (BamD/ComL family)